MKKILFTVFILSFALLSGCGNKNYNYQDNESKLYKQFNILDPTKVDLTNNSKSVPTMSVQLTKADVKAFQELLKNNPNKVYKLYLNWPLLNKKSDDNSNLENMYDNNLTNNSIGVYVYYMYLTKYENLSNDIALSLLQQTNDAGGYFLSFNGNNTDNSILYQSDKYVKGAGIYNNDNSPNITYLTDYYKDFIQNLTEDDINEINKKLTTVYLQNAEKQYKSYHLSLRNKLTNLLKQPPCTTKEWDKYKFSNYFMDAIKYNKVKNITPYQIAYVQDDYQTRNIDDSYKRELKRNYYTYMEYHLPQDIYDKGTYKQLNDKEKALVFNTSIKNDYQCYLKLK